jgi:hypothetical protein
LKRRDGSRHGDRLKRGNGGDASGALVQLLEHDRGQHTVVHGAVVHRERRQRCRASKEEERALGGPMMGREAGEAWAGKVISTEKSSWAAKTFGPN